VAAWNLVDRALENGGKDNVTVLILDVLAIEPWSPDVTERQSDGARGRQGDGGVPRSGHGRPDEMGAQDDEGEQALPSPDRPVAPSPGRPVAPSGPLDRLKGLFTK
jgi:hypothetical protein